MLDQQTADRHPGAADGSKLTAIAAAPTAALPRWGKAAALDWFAPRIRSARVPSSCRISRRRWQQDRRGALDECIERLGEVRYAVRSDARLEDQLRASLAGHFPTRLDVPKAQLEAAIDHLFATLDDVDDGVLVQPMVSPCRYLGVAATHRIHDGAPWYCIELDAPGSAAVTAGRASGRQLAIARQALAAGAMPEAVVSPYREVLTTLLEVESLVPRVPLEIELALGDGPAPLVHLLQVRPLASAARWQAAAGPLALPVLDALTQPDPLPGVVGSRSVWSLMSDWNPAELIGAHPRPLARALFAELIGCGSWWNARARLGYQPPPDPRVPLLRDVAGRPWVDVRRSANSLLPAGLAAGQRQVLVDSWLRRLGAQPGLHDKVEFAVFRTVQDFHPLDAARHDPDNALDTRTRADWQLALGRLTRDLLQPQRLARIRAGCVPAAPASSAPGAWQRHLATAREQAELFAMLARMAFAADAQLRSAVERGALTPQRALQLRASRRSVACMLAAAHGDGQPAQDGNGHLRPGTFDITRPTWASSCTRPGFQRADAPAPFAPEPSERRALGTLLHEAGLALDVDPWLHLVLDANQAREWGKHVFSSHVSLLLEAIAGDLVASGVDRETASWLDLQQLRRCMRLDLRSRASFCCQQADEARQRYQDQQRLIVSPLLCSASDACVADSLGLLPNFIGQAVVDAPVVALDEQTAPDHPLPLRGAIVVLRHADPGYDWLFDRGIAGLVTAWGGAHSHMAIRCAEFGLSAALGCGERLFEHACRASRARIDPEQASLWLQ
jgi:glutamine kinase